MSVKLRPHAAPAALVSVAVVLALAVVAVVALSGAEAAGQGQPKCGDTITKDTTLHKDLVNCPNIGIIIGADNVTLDLNGHRVDGDAAPCTGCHPRKEFTDIGVLNDRHDGVTVMHGSMRQFDAGAVVGEARHNRLLGISSSGNRAFGIVVFNSARSVVRHSSGTGSLDSDVGGGLGLFTSHHVRILHNSFRHSAQNGMVIAEGSEHNLIKGNLFSRNDGAGITAGFEDPASSSNVITENRVSEGRDGIRVEKGRGNLVVDNVVADTRRDGFVVLRKGEHSLLKRNVATGAGDDGFDIEGRTTKLTANRAVRNDDLGIEAVPGVIDGGGNKASGNGDPRQCTHIVCN